jgi:cytidylate kinase
MKTVNIAIDGPAGAGKSSLAKAVASKLGYTYIDTGALYRAIAFKTLQLDIAISDIVSIKQMLLRTTISFRHINGTQRVYVDGEDVTGKIRTNEISSAASAVSAIPDVRTFLLGLQRDIASKENVVMDGRDIGTVVLPNADIKIFLTASVEERAKRRYEEQKNAVGSVTYEEIVSTMITRDKNDSERTVAPLKPAIDAIILDNSGFEPHQTLESALTIIENKLKNAL